MANRDYEKIYLERIANLNWDNPANLFLTRAELGRVSPGNIKKVLRQLHQIGNSSELELVLLEHWPNGIVPRYINDDPNLENSTAALRDTLPQHLARAQKGDFRLSLTFEYENEFPDKYDNKIAKLTLVDLLLTIMAEENKDKSKLYPNLRQNPPVVEYKPLAMFFGFRHNFNPQKGYILVLDSIVDDLADRILMFMHWNQHTVEYLDYDLEAIVNPYEQGFRIPSRPNYSLPRISFRQQAMVQRLKKYGSRIDKIFSAILNAFKTLDQKFSYVQGKEELRYECIGILYEHRCKKRLMMLYVLPDKKKTWITAYLPIQIYGKI